MSNWDNLSLLQKAELMKIYTANGFNSLGGIIEHYNQFACGGVKSSNEMANGGPLDKLLSKNGNDINYGANGNIPAVRYDNGGIKSLLPINHEVVSRVLFGRPFVRNFIENNSKVESNPESIDIPTYFDVDDEELKKMNLTDKYNGYDIYSVGPYKETHYNTIKKRYNELMPIMKEHGFSDGDIDRLIPMLLTQLSLEGGWRTEREDNNFGGIMSNGKKRFFENKSDFYNYYLNNLDEKWGDDYLGEGNGWRHARNIEDYARIINREDLGLTTKNAYNEYNRTHVNPAYLYTPEWENNGTPLMDANKFGGIHKRVEAMYKLMKIRNEEYNAINGIK